MKDGEVLIKNNGYTYYYAYSLNYTRKFIPELNKVPVKYLFNPWDAPKDLLLEAGVILGVNYPKPIVDIKDSRNKALESFSML